MHEPGAVPCITMALLSRSTWLAALLCAGLVVCTTATTLTSSTVTYTDPYGRQKQYTSYFVPNRAVNGFDHLLGSTAEQAPSFAAHPVFYKQPGAFDTIRPLELRDTFLKTDGGGRVVESCYCPGHGTPCFCGAV
jgi:hypothetical protein